MYPKELLKRYFPLASPVGLSCPNPSQTISWPKIGEASLIERQYKFWFNLLEIPTAVRLSAIRMFCNSTKMTDTSWLVRRAIGTVLESCYSVRASWADLCECMLRSPDWMKNCVGIIGVRCISESRFATAVRDVLQSRGSIDAIWLAQLYLADASVNAFEDVLRS